MPLTLRLSPKSPRNMNNAEDGSVSSGHQMTPLMLDGDRSVPRGDSPPQRTNETIALNAQQDKDFFAQAARFMFCFVGLQVSYLTWGYMQVRSQTARHPPCVFREAGNHPLNQSLSTLLT